VNSHAEVGVDVDAKVTDGRYRINHHASRMHTDAVPTISFNQLNEVEGVQNEQQRSQN